MDRRWPHIPSGAPTGLALLVECKTLPSYNSLLFECGKPQLYEAWGSTAHFFEQATCCAVPGSWGCTLWQAAAKRREAMHPQVRKTASAHPEQNMACTMETFYTLAHELQKGVAHTRKIMTRSMGVSHTRRVIQELLGIHGGGASANR